MLKHFTVIPFPLMRQFVVFAEIAMGAAYHNIFRAIAATSTYGNHMINMVDIAHLFIAPVTTAFLGFILALNIFEFIYTANGFQFCPTLTRFNFPIFAPVGFMDLSIFALIFFVICLLFRGSSKGLSVFTSIFSDKIKVGVVIFLFTFICAFTVFVNVFEILVMGLYSSAYQAYRYVTIWLAFVSTKFIDRFSFVAMMTCFGGHMGNSFAYLCYLECGQACKGLAFHSGNYSELAHMCIIPRKAV